MQHHDKTFTIEDLAAMTDTSVRTVRYYIAENLLPGPGARGKSAVYTEDHLVRLRLIRLLTERRTPLAEIRDMMARVSDEEIRALLAEEESFTQTRAEREESPRAYISALLDQARAVREPMKPYLPYLPSTQKPVKPHARRIEPHEPTSGAPQGRASEWRRVQIAPGVELHIEERLESQNRALIERLLAVQQEMGDDD